MDHQFQWIPPLDFSSSTSLFLEPTTPTASSFAPTVSSARSNAQTLDLNLRQQLGVGPSPKSPYKTPRKKLRKKCIDRGSPSCHPDSSPAISERAETPTSRVRQLRERFLSIPSPKRMRISAPVELEWRHKVNGEKRNKTIPSSAPQRSTKNAFQVRESVRTCSERALDNSNGSFQCEIRASSGIVHRWAESECKKRVTQAHGWVLEDVILVGGFIYEMPFDMASPLTSGTEIESGAHISVRSCPTFPEPRLNGLRLNPINFPM